MIMVFNFEIKEYSDRKVAVCSNFDRLTTTVYFKESLRETIIIQTLKFLELEEATIKDEVLELYDGDRYTLDCTDLITEMEIH